MIEAAYLFSFDLFSQLRSTLGIDPSKPRQNCQAQFQLAVKCQLNETSLIITVRPTQPPTRTHLLAAFNT